VKRLNNSRLTDTGRIKQHYGSGYCDLQASTAACTERLLLTQPTTAILRRRLSKLSLSNMVC